jgi:hypothetical protein
MLTVLKNNAHAMSFYTGKLKYTIDPSSPSEFGEEASHEIMSKCVNQSAAEKQEKLIEEEFG